MKNETYKGRKLRVIKGRGADFGYARATVNGVDLGRYLGDEDNALRSMRGTIDHAEMVGVASARYGGEWYAPGTYDICDECMATMTVGGECLSQWCMGLRHIQALEMNAEFNQATAQQATESDWRPIDVNNTHAEALEMNKGFDNALRNAVRRVTKQLNDTDRETDMNTDKGPFTERQTQILDLVTSGLRHKEVAAELGVNLSTIRREVATITAKMGADTSAQAYYLYGRAKAFGDTATDVGQTAANAIPHARPVLRRLEAQLADRVKTLLPE